MANNIVLEGKFKNTKIDSSVSCLKIYARPSYPISSYTVKSYTVIDETNKNQYSFWKGALGVALLGGVGAIAGISGKKKKEYLVAIEWQDGEKSLISIDDEKYKVLVKSLF